MGSHSNVSHKGNPVSSWNDECTMYALRELRRNNPGSHSLYTWFRKSIALDENTELIRRESGAEYEKRKNYYCKLCELPMFSLENECPLENTLNGHMVFNNIIDPLHVRMNKSNDSNLIEVRCKRCNTYIATHIISSRRCFFIARLPCLIGFDVPLSCLYVSCGPTWRIEYLIRKDPKLINNAEIRGIAIGYANGSIPHPSAEMVNCETSGGYGFMTCVEISYHQNSKTRRALCAFIRTLLNNTPHHGVTVLCPTEGQQSKFSSTLDLPEGNIKIKTLRNFYRAPVYLQNYVDNLLHPRISEIHDLKKTLDEMSTMLTSDAELRKRTEHLITY